MELTRVQEVILVRLKLEMPPTYIKIKVEKSQWLKDVKDLKEKGLITYQLQTQEPFEDELFNLKLTTTGKIEAEKYNGYNL